MKVLGSTEKQKNIFHIREAPTTIVSLKNYLKKYYMYVCFVCVCMHHVHAVSLEVGKECQILWNRSYRPLWASMWLLETETRSSERADTECFLLLSQHSQPGDNCLSESDLS